MPDTILFEQLCLTKNRLEKINGRGKGKGMGMLALYSPSDMSDLVSSLGTSDKIYSLCIVLFDMNHFHKPMAKFA